MTISVETQAAVEKFNLMVKRASQARSKEVRLDIADATVLMGELSNILARLAVLENGTATSGMGDGHHLDGGKF